MFTDQAVLYAFSLTLLAGLSTGIGSAIAFFTRQTNTRFLSVALGFSAGVMLYVSFVEIFFKAREALEAVVPPETANLYTVLGFFGGMAFIAAIDMFVPEYENPHSVHSVQEMDEGQENLPHDEKHNFAKLKRMGMLAALAIGIHNFPEGLATFTAALTDPQLAVVIAVAIAIHNIPEGMAISIPLFYATGDRKKAFLLSLLSGLTEPVGALVGYFLLHSIFTPVVFGIVFAGVAGIMVFISLSQLLPTAEEFGEHVLCISGVVGGMVVMAASLLMLQ